MPDEPSGDRVPPVLPVAVFLVSVAVISFEVALTRCFSVLLRYHYVFLVVSVATFGLGAGGLIDYLLLRRRPGKTWEWLTWSAVLLAPLPALSVIALFRSPLSQNLTNLWLVGAVSMPAFLVAGAFLSCTLRTFSRHGGRLYGADLVGAATGSIAVVAALQFLGGTGTPMAAGSLAGLAAVGLAWHRGRRVHRALACLAAIGPAALLSFNLATQAIDLPTVPVTRERTVKTLYQELGDPSQGARIIYTDWNAFARTDVVQYHPPGEPRPWRDLYVYTDGDVPTNMYPFNGDLRPLLPDIQSFIGFLPFRTARPEKVLLIGPGGGLDILLAFAVGAEQIDGIELNPSIPKVMRRFAGFNGHLYEYRNVNISVDEGRSFLRRTDESYDLIYMALSYSATTAGTGSLALVESYLHTVEAFQDCLRRLGPEGQVVFVCPETRLLLRAFLTALEALEREGVAREDALHSLLVVDVPPELYGFGPYRHMLLVRNQPFAEADSQRISETALAMGLWPGYAPRVYEPSPFSLLSQRGADSVQFDRQVSGTTPAGEQTTVLPVTDDRPFFADLTAGLPPGYSRFVGWGVAVLLGLIVATCLANAMARPGATGHARAVTGSSKEVVPGEEGEQASAGQLPEVRDGRLQTDAGASLQVGHTGWVAEKALYFTGIGLGFMLIEVCLAQKLILYLGYPTLALAVVLFALLLGGGLGSLRSQSWPVPRLAASAAVAACAVAILAAWGATTWLDALFSTTLQWPILTRTAAAAAVLMPLGFAMGILFPTGIRRLRGTDAALIPWMWALNGTASVLASVGAMCAAKLWGFHAVLTLGGVCYAVAGGLSLLEHFGLRNAGSDAVADSANQLRSAD